MTAWLVTVALAGTADPLSDTRTDGVCRYGRSRVQLDGDGTASEAAYRLTNLVKANDIERIVVVGTEGPQTVWPRSLADGPRLGKAVSADALHLARWAVSEGSSHMEYDLRAKVEGTTYRPVTVRWTPESLVIEEGPPSVPYRTDAPSAEVLRQTRGVMLAELVGDGDAVRATQELGDAWTPIRFGMLDDALSLLTPDELERIKPLGFVRDPAAASRGDDEAHLSGRYLGGRGLVLLYDDGLLGDALNFTGTPSAPRPYFVYVLLHEMGHALVDAGPRRGQPSTLLQRYAQLPGVAPGVTTYASASPSESFAESFALFHADPDALRRCLPEVHDWFATGQHLSD